jgi:hypothetical protein
LLSCHAVVSKVVNDGELDRIDGVARGEKSLDGALVGLGRGLVLLLVGLVTNSGHGGRGTASDRAVTGVALGLLLVGLLGGSGGGTLDSLGDVLGGVVEGVADLTDDALVGSVGVGSRHFEVVVGWFGFGFGKREDVVWMVVDEERRGSKRVRGAS